MQPPPYTPMASFAADEQNQVGGRSDVRTAALDVEFANLVATLNAVLSNLAFLQRDDLGLQDGIVTTASLDATVRRLMGQWTPRGEWATAMAYSLKDLVSHSESTYVAASSHTSDDFDTDLAAGLWIPISLASIAAAAVSFSPTGGIAASTVQSALAEVDSEYRVAIAPHQYVAFGGF